MAVARLAMVSLDCADPAPLAEFWAGMLDGAVIAAVEDVSVVQAGPLMISAMRVPGFRPPAYPDGDKQIHLDLAVSDLDAAEAEALRLGATTSGHQPQPDEWRIMLDPAGHPFCLTANIPFDVD